MAYLSFSEPGFATPGGYAPAREAAAMPARLSPLEWSVVALAWTDRLSSLRRPGRVAKLLAAVFGGSATRQLADPRLEALRRMSVLTWHNGYTVAPHEVQAFHRAGFSAEQYELLVDSIGAARRRR